MRYWLSEGSREDSVKRFLPARSSSIWWAASWQVTTFYLMFDRYLVNQTVRTVVSIGLLGGFTTFSSFGLQTFTLLRDGEMGLALFNIAISNVGGLLMVWVGYSLAKIL